MKVEIVTNELKNKFVQSTRRVDSKMTSVKSVIRNLFISIICLFIPRTFCAYFQSILEEFNEIYGDSTPTELHTDPAFIAYIKGEDTVPGTHCPQKTSENVESRLVKTTAAYKGRKAVCLLHLYWKKNSVR